MVTKSQKTDSQTATGLPKTDPKNPRLHFDIYAILESSQELYFGHEVEVNVNKVETVKLTVFDEEENRERSLEKCYLSPTKRRGVERRCLLWALLKKRDAYDFGRVFFSFSEESKIIPDKIYFQPLGNHVANVRRLVKLWNIEDFSGNNEADKLESKKRVDEAAKIHDIGKPYRFKLEAKKTKQGKFQEFAYSFKGHRFLAESSDEWAKLLARGHHDWEIMLLMFGD